ncbi:hypothetical protein [Lysinibacillus sphaericus]|uniref:Uncharacterized protein n=2 Tax=Lysinibacillus sphaericus TaxID=1421 RepID=A0A6H0A0F1_LYSSH|nr:hypothetical protein [Lysinibacillus sphaericus]MBE5085789.1 hypothetical protein [Bacillus thuringiensis]ACA42364.1 hypothetical protein Bsph_p134 [Lysinibacillus sphaericus C3-41]AMO35346.1 hypothetical protein AR327_22925 [Lysinibacillus sphaericus]AMR93051.1 hypothetical protein A1T07_22860 [Lysinibacillus sphaericus]MDR0161520.1 hypothetical protein [Lysinibacillus sphaericus]
MKGVCKEAPVNSNLVIDEEYYLTPHGSQGYLVSRFPSPLSHFGAYQKKYFKVIENEVENTLESKEDDKNQDYVQHLEQLDLFSF